MTSNRLLAETVRHLFKSWFTRVGMGLWIFAFGYSWIYDLLRRAGRIPYPDPQSHIDLRKFEGDAFRFFALPFFVGLILVILGAVSALKRTNPQSPSQPYGGTFLR
jgi:hypothetical protein